MRATPVDLSVKSKESDAARRALRRLAKASFALGVCLFVLGGTLLRVNHQLATALSFVVGFDALIFVGIWLFAAEYPASRRDARGGAVLGAIIGALFLTLPCVTMPFFPWWVAVIPILAGGLAGGFFLASFAVSIGNLRRRLPPRGKRMDVDRSGDSGALVDPWLDSP